MLESSTQLFLRHVSCWRRTPADTLSDSSATAIRGATDLGTTVLDYAYKRRAQKQSRVAEKHYSEMFRRSSGSSAK